MNLPLVSIIIPLYNAERFIAGTIDCALKQDWRNKEIIVVDDGSTDHSLAIVKKAGCGKVKIISQENRGASAARNRGLKEAQGDYIQFLDADDLLHQNKITLQITRLNNFPAHICCSSSAFFYDDTDPRSASVIPAGFQQEVYRPDDFLLDLYENSMVAVHSWLTPRRIIEQAGPWNEQLTVDDDGEFFCRVILNAEGVINCEQAISYYRKHTEGVTLSGQLTDSAYQSMLTSLSLKHKALLERSTQHHRINRLFARKYFQTGVNAYPQHRSVSDKAIAKSVLYNNKDQSYSAGPVTTRVSQLLGWKAGRLLTYWRFGL